jgi:cysteine synthase A
MLWLPRTNVFAWITLHWPSPSRAAARQILYGLILGFSLSLTTNSIRQYFQRRKELAQGRQFELEARPIELRSDEVLSGVTGLIGSFTRVYTLYTLAKLMHWTGNTPLVRINSLSDALGVEVLGKAEVIFTLSSVVPKLIRESISIQAEASKIVLRYGVTFHSILSIHEY